MPFCSNHSTIIFLKEGINSKEIDPTYYNNYPEFSSSYKTFTSTKLSDSIKYLNNSNEVESGEYNTKILNIPALQVPSKKEVKKWLRKISNVNEKSSTSFSKDKISPRSSIDGKSYEKNLSNEHISFNISNEITGSTLKNNYIKEEKNYKSNQLSDTTKFITTMVMELHISTKENKKPNPQEDSILAIFYSTFNGTGQEIFTGMLAYESDEYNSRYNDCYQFPVNISKVNSESELFNKFIKVMQLWNPDILIGYEIEMLSWGYLIKRGKMLGFDLLQSLSRIPTVEQKYIDDKSIEIIGRIVLNLWRIIKHEIALQSYTIENVSYYILSERIPKYSFKTLTSWWNLRNCNNRYKTINYYLNHLNVIIKILDKLDIISQNSELAKLFGIQFYEVLSRGSQFRVESMMLRLAKPFNYILVSPDVQQRAKMKAPEFLPLIFEPESKFYPDPVLVLDFQSLYPSIIIAYNYCFSTCLGRVDLLKENQPYEFGAFYLKQSDGVLKSLLNNNDLIFSPCRVAFVNANIRQGILPKMLNEILHTRLMVKDSMKLYKDNVYLQRILHSRQLGLKLIANVTYGYTAANFSGRMPCVELGDSIVSKGRETLLRAIKLVEETTKWGAKVVYGDTDSLFVLLKGKSREEAFAIGKEIADAVTNDNPKPVKLKLEKVYQPCILQTKKRYVGYMYESTSQDKPTFDAKGIETVRRDGCPAVSKVKI